jgi:hypothetical protein
MTITASMNLDQLAQRMGQSATADDSIALRVILCDSPYIDTLEIPDRVWTRMAQEAIEAAAVCSRNPRLTPRPGGPRK